MVSTPPSAQNQRVTRWRDQVEAHLRAQQWPECIKACRSLLDIAPRHHFAQETLATALLQLGDNAGALQAVQRLLELSPRDPFHRLRLATLLQINGHHGAATREFERVTHIYPDAPFSADAADAMENLDRLQTSQILILAAEQSEFRWQLERNPAQTLEESGFYLSEGGLDMLRNMLPGGGEDAPSLRERVH